MRYQDLQGWLELDCRLADLERCHAIGDNYSFDGDGKVVGLSSVVVEVLPTSDRTADRKYNVLGPAPR